MIHPNDISTAKPLPSPFEIKSPERGTAAEPERHQAAKGFSQYVEANNVTSIESTDVGRTIDAEEIIERATKENLSSTADAQALLSPKQQLNTDIESKALNGLSHEFFVETDNEGYSGNQDVKKDAELYNSNTTSTELKTVTGTAAMTNNNRGGKIQLEISPPQESKPSSKLNTTDVFTNPTPPKAELVLSEGKTTKQGVQSADHVLDTELIAEAELVLSEGKTTKQGIQSTEHVVDAELIAEDAEVSFDIDTETETETDKDIAAERLISSRSNNETQLNSSTANSENVSFALSNNNKDSKTQLETRPPQESKPSSKLNTTDMFAKPTLKASSELDTTDVFTNPTPKPSSKLNTTDVFTKPTPPKAELVLSEGKTTKQGVQSTDHVLDVELIAEAELVLSEGKTTKQGIQSIEHVLDTELIAEDAEVSFDTDTDTDKVIAAERLISSRSNNETQLNSSTANSQNVSFALSNNNKDSKTQLEIRPQQESKTSSKLNTTDMFTKPTPPKAELVLSEGKTNKQGVQSTEHVLDAELIAEDAEVSFDIDTDIAAERLISTRSNNETQLNSSTANSQNISFAPSNILNGTVALDNSLFSASSLTTPLSNQAPSLTATPATIIAASLTNASVTSVMQSIVKTVETQKGVSVRLDPPEMGRVYIDYILDGDRSVTAFVRADLPEALGQLRDQSAQLQNFLKEQGFDDVNLSFGQNTPEHKSFEEENSKGTSYFMKPKNTPELDLAAQVNNPGTTLLRSHNNTSLDIKL